MQRLFRLALVMFLTVGLVVDSASACRWLSSRCGGYRSVATRCIPSPCCNPCYVSCLPAPCCEEPCCEEIVEPDPCCGGESIVVDQTVIGQTVVESAAKPTPTEAPTPAGGWSSEEPAGDRAMVHKPVEPEVMPAIEEPAPAIEVAPANLDLPGAPTPTPPAELTFEEPAVEPAEAPAPDPIEMPAEEPAEASASDDLFGAPVEQPAEVPIEMPVEEPAGDDLFGAPVEQPAEAPIEMPVEEPAGDDLFGAPVEQPAEAPIEMPMEEPAGDDLFGAPVEQPAEAPIEMPMEEPASDDLFGEPAKEAPEAAEDDLFGDFGSILQQEGGLGSIALRTWVDSTGTYSCDARLIAVFDGKAKLLKANGNTSTVAFSRLSGTDLAFVNLQASATKAQSLSLTAQR